MQPWSAVQMQPVPTGTGDVTLVDSITRAPFDPFVKKKLDLYVCGITPYDAAHVGHLFTYLMFDTLIRISKDLGYPVTYVQNITDIDDPLFERARASGESWENIARTQIDKYKEAMTCLRIIPPDHFYSVTESMDVIKDAVQSLEPNSYKLADASYFKVDEKQIEMFTKLHYEELIDLARQRGGDPDNLGKVGKLDPKIWLKSLADEPQWQSVFGTGRPGWHIECVAIANKYLPNTFDVQGGGKDLIFPHHAMCEQMNQVLYNRPLARGFMHVELVGYQGQKMSKSLGNLVFIDQLIDQEYSANVIRLALLGQSWREYWEFEFEILIKAADRFAAWEEAIKIGYFPSVEILRDIFKKYLYQDLNIQLTLNAIDLAIKKQNLISDLQESISLISNIFGIELN